MKKTSVIILNWNRKHDVSETLERLQRQTVKPFEIIVVDNASTDGSQVFIKKNFPKVKVIGLDKNYGLEGFNFGMEKAVGDFFLLLASDSMPESHLIDRHIKKFKKNPLLGVSCPVTYEFKSKEVLGPNYEIEEDKYGGHKVTYFDGNGICLKRSVFEKTGGYSPDYFICLEELEWAVRILSHGFEIACFPDVKNYNVKSKVGSQRKKYGYYYARNWIWFYVKYLPLREIPNFLILHLKSFFIKSNRNDGTMNKVDMIKGVWDGVMRSPKFILTRKVLSPKIIKRLKLDLFPNNLHLYIKN